VKVWNSETGRNIANLKGHNGSIYSIKMASDGSTAMSVGTDKYIRMWDVRAKSQIAAIDGTSFEEMNEICFSSSPLDNNSSSGL
jgi:WD40 repeat protein